MKTILTFCLLLALSAAHSFALDKSELDLRIRKIINAFDNMQEKPEKRVPPETLRKAQAILLLDRTKAGFLFAYQGGSGVAMVRNSKSEWSPVAFYKANEASLGFQIGGQKSFVVILMMSTNATRLLTEPNANFGGEASGTAGESTGKAEGNVNPPSPSVLVYDDRHGLYGGAAVKGGEISPDENANLIYYGQAITPREILFERKVKPTPAATELAKKIAELSKGK